MGKVADIKTNLQTRALALKTAYVKHSFAVNIEDNKFKGNSKQLSVLPSSAVEVDGLIGSFSMDHVYNYTFTNSYNAGAKNQLGDALKVQRIQELMDDVLDVYSDAVTNKGSIDPSILVINDLNIEEPEFDDNEKTIIVKCSILVKYKVNT